MKLPRFEKKIVGVILHFFMTMGYFCIFVCFNYPLAQKIMLMFLSILRRLTSDRHHIAKRLQALLILRNCSIDVSSRPISFKYNATLDNEISNLTVENNIKRSWPTSLGFSLLVSV